MSPSMKTLRWAGFLPGGFLGGLIVGCLAWLPFAAPYLLFRKFEGLAVWGCVASYLAYLYTFLHLSWFISPTKSKTEGWIILVFACLITLDGLRRGIAAFDYVGAPLLAAVLGTIHLFRFFLIACKGENDHGPCLGITYFFLLALVIAAVVLIVVNWHSL